MAIDASDYQLLAKAVSAYMLQAITRARSLSNTGLTSGRVEGINTDEESHIGQLRWINRVSPTWNSPNTSGAGTDGVTTDNSTNMATYIKSIRAIGQEINTQSELISKTNGIELFGQQLVDWQDELESDAIHQTLQGIAKYEASRGPGLLKYSTDPETAAVGAFVDINAAGEFGAAATEAADARSLFNNGTSYGARSGSRLFKAIGMRWQDREAPYYYLIVNPELYSTLRENNLVDDTPVVEGNLTFQTIYGGKFRIILSALAMGNLSGESNVNGESSKTTFVVRPSAMAFVPFPVITPTEIERSAKANKGGGSVQIWYRTGFVCHPLGYNWAGSSTSNTENSTFNNAASWTRKDKALNCGILPIFHA